MKQPHVCILTTAHPTDDVRVRHKMAASFLGAGFKVSWLGRDHAFFDPDSKNSTEIEFHLVNSGTGRTGRVLSRYRLAGEARAMQDVDVFYAPEPDSAALAAKVARRSGARVIFDIHEVFHTYMLDRWLHGMELSMVRRAVWNFVNRTCSKCDLVVGTCTPTLAPYRDACKQAMVVRNCAPRWFADVPPADIAAPTRKTFSIMHGKSDLGRGTLLVIRALGLVAKHAPHVRVVMFDRFGGEDDPARQQFWQYADKAGVRSMIELRQGVPIEEMPDLLRSCDVGMIAYDRNMGVDTLANRPFEYMAVGLPILAPVYGKALSTVIKTEDCGVLVDFEDPANVADGILQLVSNADRTREMGENARSSFLLRHNWEVEVAPLLEHVERWSRDA